ncbi:hypothetical protein EN817_01965 [Mesorhizobium sp. M3A.F.Ca.ET.174.01.1.1]|nr:hypothetical protein EJ074_02235 [Mesorhizobium sp. M3A.F.Ca.ET.080.04.2.1]PBB87282.1 hypothetical protein CK216_08385 [Mesorhizobium sp. WSM3876]RWB70370.1 MAG: hypothetical protein EOQ49_18585 [Mesorhizobium sp.]TGS65592.1 hypothetical protein EN844_18030 [Mesorhizobium sp. M3A.F.Ca.ET.201.01.1.1]TGS89652.1 hypothetical protein EN818_01965 [Mesorhizobium sp. M3A.F.Ca.ET.175.01.1.1]TGT31426.1 hypothetical protein EN817_01965 [Mesorhizobium sp. M3A.F.Ca.ET.174.01.1.1]TGT60267.1 hypothetica
MASAATTAIAKPFTYVNARFGTSCTFPDEIFSDPLPEPENGDGQQWLSADGASLTCSGIYNVDNDTPGSFVAGEKAGSGPSHKITYSKTGRDWAVLSGINGDKVFYERRLFGKDGVIRTVWIEYPSSLKAKYDPLAGAIAASLRGP